MLVNADLHEAKRERERRASQEALRKARERRPVRAERKAEPRVRPEPSKGLPEAGAVEVVSNIRALAKTFGVAVVAALVVIGLMVAGAV